MSGDNVDGASAAVALMREFVGALAAELPEVQRARLDAAVAVVLARMLDTARGGDDADLR